MLPIPAEAPAHWTDVLELVHRSTDRLRSRKCSSEETASIGEAFVRLAQDPKSKWEVRSAVAQALEHLPPESALPALAALLNDSHASVRADAERAQARRMERTSTDYLKDEHAELLAKSFADLEMTHGRKARAAAMRVAERYVSVHVREAHHELVNPLRTLHNNLALLGRRLRSPRARNNVETARRQAEYLIKMMECVRDFHDPLEPDFQPSNLRELVEDAARLVSGPLRMRKSIDPELRLDADRTLLTAAFRNIIRNAQEAYDGLDDRPPRLAIEATERDGWIVITFRDRGCGISEENLKVVFKRFKTTKREKGGLGFGLCFAKHVVVSAHGGEIGIASIEGKSTTVTLSLPRVQERT